MDFGIDIFATDTTMPPFDLARHCERLGFESCGCPSTATSPPRGPRHGGAARTLHPSRRSTGAPTTPWWRWARWRRSPTIKLGTGITLLAQRDPIWTAKEVATVDHLSNGRFLFGVGYGWNVEEMNHHGTEYRQRRALLREKVLLMKALWTQDEASFDGETSSLWSRRGRGRSRCSSPIPR
jgi:alkanesulfonate monooxygenase SsuD/methylene tetrahydromethanopterin reductase-like flavin-dependent oxidoreductase (luciferase family)